MVPGRGGPQPPAPMPLVRGGRPRKRWRYVGVFGPEVLLCVGAAWIGPLAQAFWAVWDRQERTLRERTILWRPARAVRLAPGRVTVRDRDAAIDLELAEEPGIAVTCPHGAQRVWTRKQAGIAARGTIGLGARRLEIDARAVVDDTVGHHARRTAWRWCAGVGATASGRPAAWNLVAGVNDPLRGSERALWLDGAAREVGPVAFAADLDAVAFAEGGALRFAAEAVRERHDDLLLVRSDYRQPFGTFTGELPGGERLAEGYGVMEEHRALW